jgi:uncharacterized membrane protein YecN with MAPEG domain
MPLTIACMLVAGRFLHGIYFAHHGLPWPLRTLGMSLTVFGQTAAIFAIAVSLIG